jgi:hypothetical protein
LNEHKAAGAERYKQIAQGRFDNSQGGFRAPNAPERIVDEAARTAEQFFHCFVAELAPVPSDKFFGFHKHHHMDLNFFMAWETFARALSCEQFRMRAISP